MKDLFKSDGSNSKTVNEKLDAIRWNSLFIEQQRLRPNCKWFIQWNMEKEKKKSDL